MWANRGFAMSEIWIVAVVMQSRLGLEARVIERERNLRQHETALAAIVRECLLSNIEFDARLQLVCQTGAEALGIDAGVITLRNPDGKTTTVLNAWGKFPNMRVPPARHRA